MNVVRKEDRGAFWSRLYGSKDEVLRSVLKNTSWAAFGQVIAAFVAFAETILLARYLSLNDFGVLITLTSAAEFVYGILDFRSAEAAIKFIPEIKKAKGNCGTSAFLKALLLLDLTVGLGSLAIIAFLGQVILRWGQIQIDYRVPLLVLSFGLAFRSIVRCVGSYFRISHRFTQATILGSIALLMRLVLIVIAGILTPTIAAFAWASAIANILYTAIMGIAFACAYRADGLSLRKARLDAL